MYKLKGKRGLKSLLQITIICYMNKKNTTQFMFKNVQNKTHFKTQSSN
jgi:hypothetical protein